jgi:hypothetical protein
MWTTIRTVPAFATAASIAIEEALAAWMELHYAGCARLFGVVTEYMGESAQCAVRNLPVPENGFTIRRTILMTQDPSGRVRSQWVRPQGCQSMRLIPSIRRRLRVDPFSGVRFIDV